MGDTEKIRSMYVVSSDLFERANERAGKVKAERKH